MVNAPKYPQNLLDDGKIRDVHIEASRNLAKLEGILSYIPDVEVLIESIPLQEARLSSHIENIVTSADEVFRAYSAGEGESDANVRDVISYRNALMKARDRDVSVKLMEEICSTIKMKNLHIRSTVNDVVYLKDQNGHIVSTPPSGNDVPRLLEGLIHYSDSEDEDPLVKMLVFHGMFEMIHPFKDGNGRTGRILNEVLLQRYGLLSKPVLYLSKFLVENRRDYYRVLRKLERDNNWKDYAYFMLCGVRDSADYTMTLITEIQRSLQNAYTRSTENWYSKELVNLLYSHIYSRPKHLVEAGLVSRNTASSYLQKLEVLGIVKGEKAGKGNIYLNTELFEIFTK